MANWQPLPRHSHAAVGIGSKLYVWGGYSSDSIATKALEIFDVSSVAWERLPQILQGPDMPDGLHSMAVTSDGKTAYCCGGETGLYPNCTYYNTLYQFIPSQHLCRELQLTGPGSHAAPEKTAGSSIVHFRDTLILYGGWTGQRRTNELHVWDLKSGEREQSVWYWIDGIHDS